MAWDPAADLRYGDERSRPFADLLARIGAADPALVVDLGCGPGNLTAILAQRWPGAAVVGVDSSPQMLAQAQAQAVPGVRFELGDIATWSPAVPAPEVIISNAALQWVPGHLPMLARWAGALAPGSWLALQVPANFDAPSHRLMRETADLPQFRERLRGVLRHGDAAPAASEYWQVLTAAGCAVDVWDTTYLHALPGADPVLEWVRGTGLRPVLAALDAASAAQFEAIYGQRLREAYPAGPDGTLFPFARRFAVARVQ